MPFLQNILILALCSMVSLFSAKGQTIYATHQSYLDSIPIKYPGVTAMNAIVLGNAGTTASDIHDLSPLAQLKTLTDGLIIRNNHHLKTLDGLQNLEAVGGNGIAITGNDSLQSMAALQNISYLHDYLKIKNNPMLTEIGSLNKVSETYYVEIIDNKNMTMLNGLKNLQSADDLTIKGNQFKSIDLQKLESIYILQISNEKELKDLTGLSSLKKLINHFIIDINQCPRLKDLTGLNPSDFPENGSVQIRSNDSLLSLTPFSNWGIDTVSIFVEKNKMLPKIEFLNGPINGYKFYIRSNEQLKEIRLAKLEKAFRFNIEKNPALQTIEMPLLKTVTDSLKFFDNQNLESLGDLGSLERVGDCFLMSQLPKLKNLHGIENLKRVDGGFFMYPTGVPSVNIQPFDSLSALCKFNQFTYTPIFYISMLPKLKTLDGMENFRHTNSFSILDAPKLEQINGLTNLDTFGVENPKYPQQLDFEGVKSLKTIEPLRDNLFYNLVPWEGTSFHVEGSDSMTLAALDHFNCGTVGLANCSNLTSIDFPLFVRSWPEQYGIGVGNCPKLTSLDGFSKFKVLHNPDAKINILQNASLTDCSAICEMRKSIPAAQFNITGNPFPCDALLSIEENVCDTLSAVTDPTGKEIGHLLLFPNPATEQLQIGMDGLGFPCEVRVFNQLGQLAAHEIWMDNAQKMDVSGFPNGIYWVCLPRSGVVGRFVKLGGNP